MVYAVSINDGWDQGGGGAALIRSLFRLAPTQFPIRNKTS